MNTHQVLLVEDDRATAALLKTVLSRGGFDVMAAGTVADALSLLESRPGHLILDIGLPDGNGRVVLDSVRRRGLPMQVIITTGWGDDHQVGDLSPDLVMSKPVDHRELLVALGSPDGN